MLRHKNAAGWIVRCIPRYEFTIAENDQVVIRGTVRGTHQGVFSGIQPTGKQVTVAALEIIRIENGKFVEHWGGTDTYNLLQQLGAIK